MERRDVQIGLAVLAAAVIGFLIALVAFGNDDNGAAPVNASATSTTTTATDATTTATTPSGTTTTTTTAPETVTAPRNSDASVGGCIDLWNGPNNRGAQILLVNVASQQAVRVHVGATTDVPPKCLVTVIANDGSAFTFPEGGGTTYPYAPTPSRSTSKELPESQRTQNALEQPDGSLKAR